MQKLGVISGKDAAQYADTVGQFLMDRYGSKDMDRYGQKTWIATGQKTRS